MSKGEKKRKKVHSRTEGLRRTGWADSPWNYAFWRQQHCYTVQVRHHQTCCPTCISSIACSLGGYSAFRFHPCLYQAELKTVIEGGRKRNSRHQSALLFCLSCVQIKTKALQAMQTWLFPECFLSPVFVSSSLCLWLCTSNTQIDTVHALKSLSCIAPWK